VTLPRTFAAEAVTQDAFLDGRLPIRQPRHGYRAGADSVLLAAAVAAKAGDSVLELGCGAGAASLCLATRVAGLRLTGVERQAAYAALARENARAAGLPFEVVTGDLENLPPALRARSFDHVFANPPYFAADDGTAARDAGRERALREETPLAAWIAAARARLRPKGWVTLIQGVARLPECLAALGCGFGAMSVLPIAARRGGNPSRVLIRARKGARAPFALLSPLILHRGDGDDHTPLAQAILRDGAALRWGVARD